MQKTPLSVLKDVFGYTEFRQLQETVINSVLKKNDTLVIMPTGSGKSICYQIPALIFDGLTVVVSPLISLMKDQVDQLADLGVEAAMLNSSLTPFTYANNVKRINNGSVKLLYIAPESLMKKDIQQLLKTVGVACLTIDEAHCISEWGHDFRPEYRRLATLRKRFPDAVCMALTATATPQVQQDICNSLNFKQENVFVSSFNRENLFLQVMSKDDPQDQLITFLQQYKNESGIIYCSTRKNVDKITIFLNQNGFKSKPYHAGLADKKRQTAQDAFLYDDVHIIVATVAFGMGINKSNVRFVVHYDLPKSVENYYQEIGRAGRDGLRSHCLLLFGYGDIHTVRFLIDQKSDPDQRAIAHSQVDRMIDFAESRSCRRISLLNYFGETFTSENCDACDNCTMTKERDETNVTEFAQMYLSCIYRTGQLFGANHIIDVLRGSAAEKIIQRRHHEISTYGIGKKLSKKQWIQLSRQFLQKELLVKDPEYGSLKLNNASLAVMKGEQKVFAELIADKPKVKTKSKTRALIKNTKYDEILFDRLRAKRKELADANRIPPYVIFSDKTLADLSAKLPQTKQKMLSIHGIGEVKLKRYGEIFLKIIQHRKRELK